MRDATVYLYTKYIVTICRILRQDVYQGPYEQSIYPIQLYASPLTKQYAHQNMPISGCLPRITK